MCGITIAIFQSTLPTRGSDDIIAYMRKKHNVISIHAPHEGERLLPIGYLDISPTISIHAPHEGERHYFAVDDYYVQFISIHAPHEGERLLAPASFNVFIVFQSTLPTRGSDGDGCGLAPDGRDFNPRSPRGGATAYLFQCAKRHTDFNPRSPRGGAT